MIEVVCERCHISYPFYEPPRVLHGSPGPEGSLRFEYSDQPRWRKLYTKDCERCRTPRSGRMRTYSGVDLDPWWLRAEDIVLTDIAHHLSQLCRFGGATRGFYSVAQHSVELSHRVGPEHKKWALLHDAAEAYLGDVVRPIKTRSEFDAYRCAERFALGAIARRFDLCYPVPVAVIEADDEIGNLEWREYISESYSRQLPNGFWAPWTAEKRFLDRARQLGIE